MSKLMKPFSGIAVMALLVACAPTAPESALRQSVHTISLPQLAREIDQHRGEIVRTCGARFEQRRRNDRPAGSWMLTTQDPHTSRQVTIIVAECGDRRPPLENGCITGRIAREDGSLEEPEIVAITDDWIINNEWWLHPQCPGS